VSSTSLDATAIFDQCQGVTRWRTDLTASGHPTTRGPTAVVGTYSPTAGPTKPFKPNAADQTMLVTQLSTALSGVKSCTFDLTTTGGTSIKVDLKQLNKATIKVEGTVVPLDATSANGWNMVNETTLQLFGSACDAWRNPSAKTIDFNFPCEIIVE
jgi:3D (Asp-Asp-Asp) domain-containing protein